MRKIRTIAAMMLAGLTLALTAATPVDALIPNPQHSLRFSTPLTGTAKPYTLELIARDLGTSSDIQLNLTRRATTGNHPIQQHSWYVSDVAFSCANNTTRCELDTGTHMGSYGRIHLVFNSTAPAVTTHHGCPNNLHVDNTQTSRSGKVTGTLRLETGTGFFGTIQNRNIAPVHIPSSVKAKASKFSYGTSCPPTSTPCLRTFFIGISAGAEGAISAYQVTGAGYGSGLWDVADSTVATDVTVVHRILGRTHASVVHVTSNSPSALETIALKLPFQPFLTGHATFTGAGAPTRTDFSGCRETDRNGSVTGSFKVRLDGYGPYSWSGTLAADASRFVPH